MKPKEYAERLRKAGNMLKKANIKTIKGATLWGQRYARRLAPHKSGALKRRIQRRPIKRKGNVVSSTLVSTVPKSFPYHFWVNETPGYKYARLARKRARSGAWPTKRLRARWPKHYVKRFLYRQTKHTGIPGYFTKTSMALAKKFPQIAVKEMIRTLKILEG